MEITFKDHEINHRVIEMYMTMTLDGKDRRIFAWVDEMQYEQDWEFCDKKDQEWYGDFADQEDGDEKAEEIGEAVWEEFKKNT